MHIELATVDQPEVLTLRAQLYALHATLYPKIHLHPLTIDTLLAPEVRFLVARDDDGTAIGCVALVRRGAYAKVKSMVVDAGARGQGIGRALLDQLALPRADGRSALAQAHDRRAPA
jgi:putative acetyltransferase